MENIKNIRSTLLNSLFRNPHPINKKEYNKARSVLYPKEADFVSFLTCNSHEMPLKARDILLDLLYYSDCPPPTRLLLNLLDSQQYDKPTVKQGDYIPSDHFSHLVHLYLLGLYIFSYHENLHKRCVIELNRQRRAIDNPYVSNSALASYELFSYVWKPFVLFHDLGYPLERIKPDERIEKKDWIKPFTRIIKSIGKDISFKVVAKLIAARGLLDIDCHVTFEEMYLSIIEKTHFASSDATGSDSENDLNNHFHTLYDDYRRYVYVPSITGTHDLYLINSVLHKTKMCAFLEDTTGEAVMSVFGNAFNAEYCPDVFVKDKKALKFKKKIDPRRIFSEGIAPQDNYQWHFFVDKPKNLLEEIIKNIFANNFDSFDRVSRQITDLDSFRSIVTKGKDSASLLGSFVFKRLIEMRGYIEPESAYETIQCKINMFAKQLKKVVPKISNMVGEAVSETLSNAIEDEKTRYLNAIQSGGGEDIAVMVTKILDTKSFKDSFKIRLENNIDKNISHPVRLWDDTKICTNYIRRLIDENIQKKRNIDKDPLGKTTTTFDEEFSLSILRGHKTFTEKVDRLMFQEKLQDFHSLVDKYSPSWVEDINIKPEKFIDHGFASAIVALTVAWEYDSFLQIVNADIESEEPITVGDGVLRIAFGGYLPNRIHSLCLTNSLLASQVAKSIIIHNLYPSQIQNTEKEAFPNKYYRTSLAVQPFTYVALLADSLQKWDRAFLANEARSQIADYIPGNSYNIEIKDNMINVTLANSHINMKRADEELRDTLKSFLRDAHTILQLNISEF